MRKAVLNIIAVLFLNFILSIISFRLYAHPGSTGPSGCHMDYVTKQYHCHQQKQTNPLQTYYYIKYKGNTYGPYKSYASCMSAIRGAGLTGAYCSSSKY